MFVSQAGIENDPRRSERKGLSRRGIHVQPALGPMNLPASLDRPWRCSSSCSCRLGPIQTWSDLCSPQQCHSAFPSADIMMDLETRQLTVAPIKPDICWEPMTPEVGRTSNSDPSLQLSSSMPTPGIYPMSLPASRSTHCLCGDNAHLQTLVPIVRTPALRRGESTPDVPRRTSPSPVLPFMASMSALLSGTRSGRMTYPSRPSLASASCLRWGESC